jgi:hypothetical protein
MAMLDLYVPSEFKEIKIFSDEMNSPTIDQLFCTFECLAGWVVLHAIQLTDLPQINSHFTVHVKTDSKSQLGLILETFKNNNAAANRHFRQKIKLAGKEFFEHVLDTTDDESIRNSLKTFLVKFKQYLLTNYTDHEYITDTGLITHLYEFHLSDAYQTKKSLDSLLTIHRNPTDASDRCKTADIREIISATSTDLRILNRRLRLFSNNKVMKGVVDEQVFLASIFCCPSTRKLVKSALGIKGHLHVQTSVHHFINMIKEEFQPFLYTYGEAEGKSWFEITETETDELQFTSNIEKFYQACVNIKSDSIGLDMRKIAAAFLTSDLISSLPLFKEFIEINKKTVKRCVEHIQNVEQTLNEYVIGQEESKTSLINLFRKTLIKENNANNSLMLYGASGCGKTALARQFSLAVAQEGLTYNLNIINMEMMRDKDSMTLFGCGHVYNAASIGELTS